LYFRSSFVIFARVKSVVAFAICIMLFSIFTGDKGVPALLKARRDARVLSLQIAALREENARLKARAEALRTDAPTIEALARETVGRARADEIVVTRPR
jgi:cell division protein FtsB